MRTKLLISNEKSTYFDFFATDSGSINYGNKTYTLTFVDNRPQMEIKLIRLQEKEQVKDVLKFYNAILPNIAFQSVFMGEHLMFADPTAVIRNHTVMTSAGSTLVSPYVGRGVCVTGTAFDNNSGTHMNTVALPLSTLGLYSMTTCFNGCHDELARTVWTQTLKTHFARIGDFFTSLNLFQHLHTILSNEISMLTGGFGQSLFLYFTSSYFANQSKANPKSMTTTLVDALDSYTTKLGESATPESLSSLQNQTRILVNRTPESARKDRGRLMSAGVAVQFQIRGNIPLIYGIQIRGGIRVSIPLARAAHTRHMLTNRTEWATFVIGKNVTRVNFTLLLGTPSFSDAISKFVIEKLGSEYPESVSR